MSDQMRIQPFATQLRRILAESGRNGSIFDIPRSLFHTPTAGARFAVPSLFGKFLAAPVGPSAGPHTQLSQNIVSAWLCGGRFMELKTVQVNDELAIPRPCIDMTDEGYNVEWSQELKLEQSAHEYTVAWALIHLLPRVLGWIGGSCATGELPGTIFDMSVGYTLDGIRDPRMTRFMDAMADASTQLAAIERVLRAEFPGFADVHIPSAIVNSVTVSTMHGCPPEEIERIARYLLEERHLHTVVKLNPTLLGRERVLDIVHGDLGFTEIEIPASVFEHDLQYQAALDLVRSLQPVADRLGLTFGVKLSNTLAMRNHARRLPGEEMYMSGRALYPVTMALYERLLTEFDGRLHVSYSAGADAWNAATILSCGAIPVTGCTDLLKPGGYARLAQWVERLDAEMVRRGASCLDEWASARVANVKRAAAEALADPRYKKPASRHGLPKVASALDAWDCVAAPCVEACAVEQDVPDYAALIARGEYDAALQVILSRNPLPGVTGYVCTRLCETKCTRNDYEESVAIRALKRFAEERGRAAYAASHPPAGRKVAVVGSGPSGLAAAAFLAVNGVTTTIFEARDVPGGMMRLVPPFRLPQEIIDRDVARITALGVDIRYNTPITNAPEELLAAGFDAVYVASGFQRDAPLRIRGTDGPGVIAALHLLDRARRGHAVDLGRKVVVVGGGDTAMDAARTAQRLTGNGVTVLYRRTRHEMPAAEEELEGVLEEGNQLEELVSPIEVLRENGKVVGLRCQRNTLGEPGPDGRRSPLPLPGSDFTLPCDAVVVAVGQLPELAFLDGSAVTRHPKGGLLVDAATRCAGPEGVYAGGDVLIEPGSIISACADGRRAAEAICGHLGIDFLPPAARLPRLSEEDILSAKAARARKTAQFKVAMLPLARRQGATLIESSLTESQARAEALRCVQCSTFCDKCVEVCPNRANYTFRMDPVRWALPVLGMTAGDLRVIGSEAFEVRQDRQIVHVDDFCNECDNCQTFCVHHGKPYTDKPRLFLDEESFAAERGNAFHIAANTVWRHDDGEESRLVVGGDAITYEDTAVRITLTPAWTVKEMAAKAPLDGPRSLRAAAEMLLLYRGVTGSLPWLLIGV